MNTVFIVAMLHAVPVFFLGIRSRNRFLLTVLAVTSALIALNTGSSRYNSADLTAIVIAWVAGMFVIKGSLALEKGDIARSSGEIHREPNRHEAAITAVSGLVSVQLSLGGIKDAVSAIKDDEWALGYIFGFHDSYLHSLGLRDKVEEMTVLVGSYRSLFGDSGDLLVRQSADLRAGVSYAKGRFAGSQDAEQYQSIEKPPLGLALHLRSLS